MNSVGSVWCKWDLHVHTPASYHWKGQSFHEQDPEQRDATCQAIIEKFNQLDVSAFCIMDYWHFDGFLILRDYLRRNANSTTKTIFPGIELRVPVAANYRLNAHVLLSDELSDEKLRFFLSILRFHGRADKSLIKESFIEIARRYGDDKLNEMGFKPEHRSDDAKMLELGYKTALVSHESLLNANNQVGKDNCLFVLPYGTSDGIAGLDWKTHLYEDQALMSWADCFETRKQVQVDLFLGNGYPRNPQVQVDFLKNIGGFPKPVFSGSDAHSVGSYGVYPSNRVTWLKARPTFRGLKQVCHEPKMRCYIGDQPPKLKHVEENPTRYMKSISLSKVRGSSLVDEHWFDGKELQLNPGLIAIIGNKGSGKSALADILALAGNSRCSKMEFLNSNRFRSTGNNKAEHFEATLTWHDGTPRTVNLGDESDPQEPERIRYLPQHFIEDLCNEIASGNETNFGRELKKVIFSHVAEEDRLNLGSLDELLDYRIEARKEAYGQELRTLHALNGQILAVEQEISIDSLASYEKSLGLKNLELEALEKTPLAIVEKPVQDPDDVETKATIKKIDDKKSELKQLETQITKAKGDRLSAVADQASLLRLKGQLENYRDYHQRFIEEHEEEFTLADFKIDDIVLLKIDFEPIEKRLIEVETDLERLSLLIDGKAAVEDQPVVKGLETLSAECLLAITSLQDTLNAPEKAYQAYLRALDSRTARKAAIIGTADKADTIEYFKARIIRATKQLPQELELLKNQRRDVVRKLHTELLAMRDEYVKLYAPVQKIASEAVKSAHAIKLDFDASIAVKDFEDDFLLFVHRGRTGNFYGDDESRTVVKELLAAFDFDNTESVVAFTDSIMRKLTVIRRDDEDITIPIGPQLRDADKIEQLYNFIFGLEYLEIRYNLRLGGKDISHLSPGEKGALLLVFYLLLDTEEIPIIIDQPEHNLDNQSVVRLLVDCIRTARGRRQIIVVTHNPNLAVYCDADQLIYCSIDKADGHKIEYMTGAIEESKINVKAVDILEGTYPAFDNRAKKYHKPDNAASEQAISSLADLEL